ncbi:hypothetical protein BSFA1_31820 [Burkholderia sp. SFA1]|uniref:DUF2780 domain-containing protein n=1 Tax=Caballeronia cordobensis TaxID=1353886 RepID=A0A158IDW7_CABCO|nr:MULTISPECIES: hypothetical protein [Caballeronia]MCE4544791.1 hypothetical protein [Caballeronia sp. PC1]MCE4570215.1 hypothetical protein [Caballeronia sp. CLC5]BBP98053.1 hypothetical protein BSFA1_31820 [Burkholderia sp. SFA1]SAL54792.1 hypothetical protein AWB70_04648 [Caballeronia cordobensis]
MPIRHSHRALLSAGIAIALIAPAASYAQINLQQFGFGSDKSEAAAGANGAAQPSALSSLVQNYLGANQQVLSGQSSLASAMGMSSVASQAQSAAGLLQGASGGSGVPSASVLSQLGGTQQSVSQSLMQAFAGGSTAPATATSKKTFTDGLASLGQGVKQYAGLQSDLGSVSNSMNMSSLLQAGSNPATAQAATYIAQSAPGQLQSLVQTLTQAVQYAKTNGISVPSIATSALTGTK